MKLRKVGFFRELEHGDHDGPSLTAAVRHERHPDQAKILDYLRKGEVLIVMPMVVGNVLHPESDKMVSVPILTDGTWAWPNDLQLYVEMDNVSLPEEFIQHMRTNHWQRPPPERVNLATMVL
jgi:hypothetical protein